MHPAEDVRRAVRAVLAAEPRIRVTSDRIDLDFADGVLTMTGEVDHVAGKKLALEAVAALPGISGIVDRLHVRPSAPMGDGAIRDAVRDALLQETALADCRLRVIDRGHPAVVRDPPAANGTIDIAVASGIVTLDGDVAGGGQRRIAGVLAWWVPGSRDVINGIGVVPPERDSEAGVTDAVRQVLEKDPFVNAESIVVTTRRGVVLLDGTVPRDVERKLAEDDAWYVYGVDRVVNRLGVSP